jgi:hypothetical protein
MKSTCPACGQQYRGIALTTVKDGKQVEVCPNCYKTLDAEYRKNSCLACVFFNVGTCGLYSAELDEPYVQSIRCEYFITSTDESVVKAAKEKFESSRKKAKENPKKPQTIDELLRELSKRGQTLTYFCPHCGTALKAGNKEPIQQECPNCKFDLCALDMQKLLSQHI